MPIEWAPSSWRQKTALQQPVYESEREMAEALNALASLPPLVTAWEIGTLKRQLAEAAAGRRFVLQGGDCAELFEDCESGSITNKLKILLQMSLVLTHGGRKPVVRIGRFAGQYAKPRSSDWETRNGTTLPPYRGDIVNQPGFSTEARRADPWRMVRGYERAAMTLNFLRAMARGGFADLHHPEYWDLDFVKHSPLAEEYSRIAAGIGDSLDFLESVLGVRAGEMEWVDFFTSHEGLLLPYEEAQTRLDPRSGLFYNFSTHFPWIGARTSHPGGAHVEYFRGIANPIGLKIGANVKPDEFRALIETLDPARDPGRLTILHRLGAGKISGSLPPLIREARAAGRTLTWICDPMHGNTRTTPDGIKTRSFDDILGELEQAFDIHRAEGGALNGVHIELTGENVTECTGGARGLTDADLARAYKSQVDPRLNYEQSLEIAMLLSRKMRAAG